ncbi:MAG: hypothetical protein M1820_003752 [Bogoriella megaspora]|nr:MAG: hypothetical protein M1820_003752 [Bogoriella megaspora]
MSGKGPRGGSTSPQHVLLQWVKAQGASVHGTHPSAIPGGGVGLVAGDNLKKDQTILSVPSSLLLTIDSLAVRRLRLPEKWSVHGKLATTFTLWHDDPEAPLQEWRRTLPTRKHVVDSMPLLWPATLQALLSQKSQDALSKQRARFDRDWDAAVTASILADTPAILQVFKHSWLLVNSRCFWWDYPNLPKHSKKRRKLSLDSEECMSLCPFLDFFNHSYKGCAVQFTKDGYTIVCDRNYSKGEELVISYGSYCNDYLIVEYGFALPPNPSDSLSLTPQILPLLTPAQSHLLQQSSFYGNYVLHHPTTISAPNDPTPHSPKPDASAENAPPPYVPCHRTLVALLLIQTQNSGSAKRNTQLAPAQEQKWRDFMEGKRDLAADEQRGVNELLVKVLESMGREAEDRIRDVDALTGGGEGGEVPEYGRGLVRKRWVQVRDIVRVTIGGLKGEGEEGEGE